MTDAGGSSRSWTGARRLWTAVLGVVLLAAVGWLGFGSLRAAIALAVLPVAGVGASYLVVSEGPVRQALGVAGMLLVIAGAGFAIGGGLFGIAPPALIVFLLFWLALASITFAGGRIAEGSSPTAGFVAGQIVAAIAMTVHIAVGLEVTIIFQLASPPQAAFAGWVLKGVAIAGWIAFLIGGCIAWRRGHWMVIGVPLASALLTYLVLDIGNRYVEWGLRLGP